MTQLERTVVSGNSSYSKFSVTFVHLVLQGHQDSLSQLRLDRPVQGHKTSCRVWEMPTVSDREG